MKAFCSVRTLKGTGLGVYVELGFLYNIRNIAQKMVIIHQNI